MYIYYIDFVELRNWLSANCLEMNASKSVFIHFRPPGADPIDQAHQLVIAGSPIMRVQSARFLGVYRDKHLSGDAHLDRLRRKLAAAIAGISRVRNYLSVKDSLLLYHAFFSSRMA